jgi:hypothetical protein
MKRTEWECEGIDSWRPKQRYEPSGCLENLLYLALETWEWANKSWVFEAAMWVLWLALVAWIAATWISLT